jgi:hypothetical protein
MDSGYGNGFKISTLTNPKQKNDIGLIPRLMPQDMGLMT